ncbi:hypothetical protein P7H62_14755 [Vagococcus carniphilus]|uniref:phage tail assembly chaperone G n=1 Tax=Vagococcus carniphilus TaxID=218144 RepID=UPI00288D9CDD|nr:hypothetical protein [Vagococcus carniphilus]MDT2832248.1 hypothetical protein [Vagococcus carniphilus]MDT2840758.1 hypothetical protein [Vagococcus carniphilus]MDT2855721.1 hypothetical protein [Vagococcus carniphilus]
MVSKFQQTIKLMKKNEEGKYKPTQFKSAEFLPGSVMEDANTLLLELNQAIRTNDMDEIRPVLRKAYDLIADVIFEGQFTGQEYLDGMDAREVMTITQNMLQSVTAGYDSVYAEQKKK